MDGHRIESDGLGEVPVEHDRYWGAQTQRALENFPHVKPQMPLEVCHAYGHIKKAAARAHTALGDLDPQEAGAIVQACDEVIGGELDDQFPLLVWQSGSGTQTNMNVNEVVANRANELLGAERGAKEPIHPNDDVNRGQSSNDSFVTAMHIAAYTTITNQTIPQVEGLIAAIDDKALEWREVVKSGRTHLQDATPLTVGQEWGAWADSLRDAVSNLRHANEGLLPLALGGTAVGSGLNTTKEFVAAAIANIAEQTGFPFTEAENHFVANATVDRLVRAHSALKDLAVTLFKMTQDLRWLGSGPATGLGELRFPANEPGSSIMPGKVNPSQAEVMLMMCAEVIGADTTVSISGAEGNLQLNVMRPVVIYHVLESAKLLGSGAGAMRTKFIEGMELNLTKIDDYVGRSAMLVTALAPTIGYDLATRIAHKSVEEDAPLREAAVELGVDPELYDSTIDPAKLTRPDER